MAVSITATPEPDQARIAIKAEGGTIGEAFFIGRRGRDGILSLVRETSESSRIWERDPAGQRTNLFTRPRFESLGVTATVLQNLFQNPKFITAATVQNVLRTNMAANPSFEELVRYETNYGGGTGTSEIRTDSPYQGSSYIRSTWTKAGLYGGTFANTFDVVQGKDYSVSVYVRTKILKRMRLVMRWNGSGAQQLGAEQTVRAYSTTNTGWTRLSWQGKPPAGAVSGIPSAYISEGVGQSWKAGDWLDIDAMMIEEGLQFRDYFDGSTGGFDIVNEGRYVTAWVGEANRSYSVLYPELVYNMTGNLADIRPYGDGVAIVPNGSGNASNVLLDHANQMTAGNTYTIGMEVDVLARDGISINQYAGMLTVVSKNGTTTLSTQTTEQVPVGQGNQVVGTFTIPANTTSVEVRFWNGTTKGFGTVVLRKIRIVTGTIDPGFFTGDDGTIDEITATWLTPTVYPDRGTTGTSALQVATPAGGWSWVGAAPIASKKWKKNGTYSMRIVPISDNSDSYISVPLTGISLAAGKTYTFIGTQKQLAKLSGSLHIDSRRVRVTGTGMSKLVSEQPANTANRETTIRWTFTVPAGATNIRLEFVHGGTYGAGDIFWDQVLIVEGAYSGNYFDGETGNALLGGWSGTKDASTSVRYSDVLPITVYDYEARQGQTTEYYVLTGEGVPIGDGTMLEVPEWGTWLKDPFRPHLNTKLFFNSDDKYSRKAKQVVMQPRGSRLPVVQWERRTAPEGKIRLLTETADDARRFTTLIDETGVAFLDVAEDFGIPFRYAALGDVDGVRAVSGALRDQHRYWDVEMQEVAMPIGEPSAMSATYENLMATFANYLELRGSVPNYKAVASGEWL